MKKIVGALFCFSLSVIAFSEANATTQYRFRYLDTIWDGNGNIFVPGIVDPAVKPFVCPDASGTFGENYVEQRDDSSCYYDQPTVTTASGTLPLKLDAISAANWCKSVLGNSKAVQANEVVAKGTAAGFDGASWSSRLSTTWTNGVVCSLTGTPISDPPVVRTGVLKFADFETTSDWYNVGWNNTSWANWRPPERAVLHDPEIGGNYSFAPYFVGTTEYQDVAVDTTLRNASFPVSLEWLTASWGDNPSQDTVDVWLSFLDSAKNEIGKVDAGPKSFDYKNIVINPAVTGNAPAGTAYIRVNIKIDTNFAWVDNVSLNIDGVNVSAINGIYGTPVKPHGFLKNADFENSGSNWNQNLPSYITLTYSDKSALLEDPYKAQGAHSLGNDVGNGYGGARVSQQIWLKSFDKGKPFSISWQQAIYYPGTTTDAPLLVFYKKDGTRLTSVSGTQYFDPSRFWRKRNFSGIVPVDADYVMVDVADVHNVWVDNIAFQIDGTSYSLGGNSNATIALTNCNSYLNTVNGPGDNRWGVKDEALQITYDPVLSSTLFRNWYTSGQPYKYYCVGPNDKWIVGDYMVTADNANAGLTYTAFDDNGNVLGKQSFAYTVNNPLVPEHEVDVFTFPQGTAYLMVNTNLSTQRTDDGIRATWSNINLTANGRYSVIADNTTVLRNGAAELSGQHWTNSVGGAAFISNTPSPEWHSIPQGHFAWDKFVNGTRTTIVCDTVDCGSANGYVNQMLFSYNGNGNYYQDVYVSGYDFPTGAPVELSWLQSTASNIAVTSSNVDQYSMSMKLEYYDVTGNVIGSTEIASQPPADANNSIVFGKSLDSALPAGTFRIRLYMNNMKNYGAAIDDINLRVNGTLISRNN